MSKVLVLFSIVFIGWFSQSVLAESSDNKDKKWHCEKSVKDKTIDLKNVIDRKECKKQGGKWKKSHKHDKKNEKDHKKNDGHDHD